MIFHKRQVSPSLAATFRPLTEREDRLDLDFSDSIHPSHPSIPPIPSEDLKKVKLETQETLPAPYFLPANHPDAHELWTLYGLPPSDRYGLIESGIDIQNCTKTLDGLYECVKDNQLYFVKNVYPPIQDMQPRVLAVVIVFVLFFIVGICGNSSVLTLLRSVVYDRKTRHYGSRQGENAMLYIGALAICDFLMSLSLPPAIMDSVIGFWVFDTPTCKLHHVFGSVGRIMSTFLITAMSFDRFVAVCYPHRQSLRSRKFVLCTITMLMWMALLLLFPMLVYASAKEMVLHEIQALNSDNITRFRVFKCSDMMPPGVFYYFTTSTFVMGFIIPLVLIIYFNCLLIQRLYMHKRNLARSTIPLRRVVWYTIAIAALYFFCWTPYWCSVMYAMYMTLFSDGETQSGDFMLFVIYCVHLLPYLGSSSNWILYGMLNTQLQLKTETNSDDHMSVITIVNTNQNAHTSQTLDMKNRNSRTSTIDQTTVNRSVSSEWIVLGKNCNYRNGASSTHTCTSRSCEGETTLRLIAETDQTLL